MSKISFAQNFENQNPYAIFGKTFVLGERSQEPADRVFIIENTVNESPIARIIDPNGMDVWEIDNSGNIINRIKDKTQDAFHMVQQVEGLWQRVEGQSISFEYGTVQSKKSYTYSPDGNTVSSYDVYKVRGDANGTALFEFMGNNVTGSPSGVEVSQAMTGVAGGKGLNFITTGHQRNTEPGMTHMLNGQLLNGYTIRELNHTHPGGRESMTPSGVNGDLGFANQVYQIQNKRGMPILTFNIYHPASRQRIPYGPGLR